MLQGPNREAAREKSQNVDGLEVADAEPWRRSVDTMLHRVSRHSVFYSISSANLGSMLIRLDRR